MASDRPHFQDFVVHDVKDYTKETEMLNIFFGSREDEIYNTPVYFMNQYEDEWITTDLSREMIRDVDHSEVISSRVIDSPVLGPITPRELSGGVQTLILMAYDESGNIFNASSCGNNCAKWSLKIAETKTLTITLHNIMDFGKNSFEIRILNTGSVVHNMRQFVDIAIDYV